MNIFSSLTNRIFLATALLAVLSISVAIYMVNRAVTHQAEEELVRGLEEVARLVEDYRNVVFDNFKREARFIADLPTLKAALDTKDPVTVEPVAREYQEQLAKADLFAVADRQGHLLVKLGASEIPDQALVAAMRAGATRGSMTAFRQEGRGILLVTSVPVPDPTQPEPLGTLSVGATLGDAQAQHFRALTDSEIAFGVDGAIQASTLPRETWGPMAALLSGPGVRTITLGGNEYVAITRPLADVAAKTGPMSVVLRSRTERLRFLSGLHRQLAGVAVLAVLAAILLSYGIARTVTRPLGAITSTMREMAASGDLTRRIPVPADPRWQDEDARLLATTFNAMTGSIQRFQREASQRERLSSLGRLSTVIAHEIRNPLMIIKTSLRALRREDAGADQVRSAARDIDEEVTRLNRIVTEVLDFARPIRFELSSTNLNALAEDAVRAASAVDGHARVRLDLDPAIPPVTTDGERLRQALVNVLSNAMQAVAAIPAAAADGPAIRLRTVRLDPRRVAISVIDRGAGIAPEDLPRVFDPYFTTRRTGSGIGLAISRNIIEGLGGRITVASERERGTEVRIELPVDAPNA
ncbi:MAG TPA: ATP-binding protein [Vicinamibacterales bacterium]|nr:ATP-binding protein [Vicinamibacterales bacterium]